MAIRIGDFNELRVTRNTEFGLRLEDQEGDGEDVLLPNAFVPAEGAAPGAVLRVFVYTDSEDRPVATTQEPFGIVGDVVPLEVVDVGNVGAFLDWGLDKDLLVPHREMSVPLEPGDEAVVLVRLDERTGRVVGTTRLEEHLSRAPSGFAPGQVVRALVAQRTPLGWTVALDAESLGFIYEDQAPEELRIGDSADGWVQRVRPDGRVDVTLRPPAKVAVKEDAPEILRALDRAGGFLALHDGSPPEEIERAFGISKKAFKRAIAGLYRQQKIVIEATGIRRVKLPRKS